MKKITLSLIAAIVVNTGLYAEDTKASDIELSANVALTSNYVWRGMTQSDNSPAIQGGFDVAYEGAYVGVWGSNVDFNSEASVEIDIYIGYANDIAGITYDVNYCQYTYPGESDEANFGEASLTLGYDFDVVALSAKYYVGVTTNKFNPENGWEVGASVPLPMDISIDATFGDYGNNTNSTDGEYYLIGATKSFEKFDISLAYTGMNYDDKTAGHDGNGKEGNLVATLSASF